jgi:hypothetical protein
MSDSHYLTQLDSRITKINTELTNLTSLLDTDVPTNAENSGPLYVDAVATTDPDHAANSVGAEKARLTAMLTDITEERKNTYDTYADVRQNQNDLQHIISQEQGRLDAKQQTVNDAMFQQKRLQGLNNSYRKRYKHYLYMLLVVIIMLVMLIVINRLAKVATMIPETVYDMLYIVVFVVGGFMLYFAFLDMRRRDHMDFDKVKLKAPADARTAEEEGAKRRSDIKGGDLLGLSLDCVGQECCPGDGSSDSGHPGILWDDAQNRCVYSQVNNTASGSDGNESAQSTDGTTGDTFTGMKSSALYESSTGFAPAQDIKTMDYAHYL